MKTKILSGNGTQAEIILTLPSEVVGDLEKIASFNKMKPGDLVYSYIVEGLASDAFAANRMDFTDKADAIPGKNNIIPKTVEDLLKNLTY